MERINFCEATPGSIDSIEILESYEFLVQHRIFLSPLGRDLAAFGTVRVLLTSLADAAEAAQKAFDEACILHRDISVANIKIFRGNGGSDSGHLTDWDRCLPPGSESIYNHRGERTGTWQFMPARILQECDDNLTRGPVDDKESVFWVLYYIALRYLINDKEPYDLHRELLDIFGDDRRHHNKEGDKAITLRQFSRDEKRIHFTVPGLDDVFVKLAEALSVRYTDPCTDEQIARYKKNIQQGEEFVLDHPYYLQKKRAALLENPTWLQDTLRKHAQTIPLPSNPHPSSSSIACDYHLNQIIRQPIRQRNHFARIDGIMAHGLTGNIYYRNILFI